MIRGCRGYSSLIGRTSIEITSPEPSRSQIEARYEGAATSKGTGLDDHVGSCLDEDLLEDPEVERVLERLGTKPGRPAPDTRLVDQAVRAAERVAIALASPPEDDGIPPAADHRAELTRTPRRRGCGRSRRRTVPTTVIRLSRGR